MRILPASWVRTVKAPAHKVDAESTSPPSLVRVEAASGAGKMSAAQRVAFVVVLLVFLVGLAVTIPTPDFYHGDEMLYTDAALRMCQTGDYWTPYWADGHIRLVKPIMTYWTVAGSFHLFGVNLFASRLPALLAGVGVLALAFLMGRTVFNSNITGLFAMFIAAGNLELMRLSTRATPDALLCFFMMLSMYGFARIWFQQDRSFLGPLLAYGGMGLAVQTKGLLGLVPLLANALFFVLVRPRQLSLRSLWRPMLVAIGLGLAIFWYAVMIGQHGMGALRAFVDDQVGAKISSAPLFLLSNPFVYLGAVLQYFSVWALVLIVCAFFCRSQLREFWRLNRSQCIFLLSLLVVAIFCFSFSNIRRGRYLASAYPLVACVLAGAISSITGPVLERWVGRASMGLGFLLAIGGALVVLSGFWIGPRWAIGGGVLLALGLAGIMLVRAQPTFWRWAWISAVFLIGFVVHGAAFRPILAPSALPKLARELLAMKLESSTVYVCDKRTRVAGPLRLLLNKKFQIQTITAAQIEGMVPPPSPVVIADPEPLRRANYILMKVEPDTPLSPDTTLGRKARREPFWIGLRRAPGDN